MKKLIYILGVIILCVTSSLVTFFSLSSMNIIDLKEKKEIEVTIENTSKEYDGKSLSASNYTYSGELHEGHILDVNYLGSQLEVGMVSSTANVRVLELKTGKDVSELYDLSVKPGLIQILPREIIIIFDTDMAYSGPTIDKLGYQISDGSLVVGDEMVVQYTGEVSEIGQLQISNELLNILLYNSAGHNVTNNYHITYQVRNLNIIKRDLVIKPYPLKKVYDGQKFNVDSYETISGSLLEGHHIVKVEYDLANDNVGIYAEKNLNVQIQDIFGNDVSSYYNINPNLTFDLEILPKEVELELPKLTFTDKTEALYGYTEALTNLSNLDGVFFTLSNDFSLENSGSIQEVTEEDIDINGAEAFNYQFKFTNGEIKISREILLPTLTVPYSDSAVNEMYDTKIPIIEGITIRLTQEKEYIDAGTYEITEKELKIDGDTTGLYFTNGSITITPKEVSFSRTIIKHSYNGTKFEIKDNELQLYSVNGVLEEDYYVKNVVLDSYEVSQDRIINSFIGKVLDYQIYNASGKNVTTNFTIATNSIYCQFLTNNLELQMKDISGIYYDTKDYQINELLNDFYKNKIGQGDYIQNISIPIQFIETTTLENITTTLKNQIKIVNAADRDVTFAYNVSILTNEVKFNIEPRPAKIILPSHQHVYDANSYTFADITRGKIEYDGFVNGEQPQPTSTESWQDVGVYSYTCSYDETLKSKYDISIVTGTVTITKRKAQIILPNYEKVYDANPLSFTDATKNKIVYIGFIDANKPTIGSDEQWFNAGTYSYSGTWDSAYDTNYDITLVPGTITITRKQAQIILPNYEKEYDEIPLTFEAVTTEVVNNGTTGGTSEEKKTKIQYIGFVDDSRPTINSNEQWVAVGTYSYAGKWDEEQTNYDITIVPGVITITRRKAQIILPNYNKVYDANPLTFEAVTTEEIINPTTGEPEKKYNYEYNGFAKRPIIESDEQWVNAGTYSYTCSYDPDLNSNYDIIIITGTVTITRRKAQIILPNDTREFSGDNLKFDAHLADSVKYTGFVSGQNPNISCKDEWKEVGTYSYSGTWEADYNINYDITMVPGTITITKIKAQIKLPNKNKVYDGTAFTFANISGEDITYKNFLDVERPTKLDLTCHDEWLNAGSYSYTCQWPAEYSNHYEITVVPGIITINKASVSITTAAITHVYSGSYYEIYDDELSFTSGEKTYYLRNVEIESKTRITYLSTMKEDFNTTKYSIYNSDGEDVTNNFNYSVIDLEMKFKAKTINYYIPDFNVGTYGDDVTISPITLLKDFDNNLNSNEYLEISETDEFTMNWNTFKITNLTNLSGCISITAQFPELANDIAVDGVYDITIANEETFKPSFNKRKAQIVFGDVELMYTGTPYTYANIADKTYCLGFLVDDLPVTFTCTNTWTNVGTYQYYGTWDSRLDLYYDITVTVGTIKIIN